MGAAFGAGSFPDTAKYFSYPSCVSHLPLSGTARIGANSWQMQDFLFDGRMAVRGEQLALFQVPRTNTVSGCGKTG